MPIDVRDLQYEEPLLSFQWMPQIATFPNWGPESTLQAYDVQSVSLPFSNFELQTVYLAGIRQSFGGSVDALTYNLELNLFRNPRALHWLLSWLQSIRSDRGFYGLPINYQRDLKYDLVDATGATILTATLEKSWVYAPNPLELNKSQSEAINLNIQLSATRVLFSTPVTVANG